MPSQSIAVDQISGIWSYLETIDWTEPWLWALMAAHMLCLLLTCFSIAVDSMALQTTLFCIYLVPVYAMEAINELAAEHYKLFSREQYFDDKGLFISLLVSAPLLVNALVFIFAWLYQAYRMLCRVKVARSKYQASKHQQTEEKQIGEEKVTDWLNQKEDKKEK